MEKSQNLQQYLASEAAQGLFVDEGEFCLAADKALEKLSRFALPGPGLWVLKMVQAAVRNGSPQIAFTFERRRVIVRFENQSNWEADDLLRELLSASLPENPACRHLYAGILGAALGFSQEIAWRCGTSQVSIDKSGPKTENSRGINDFVFTATRPYRSAFKTGIFTSPIRHLLRQTVQEYQALVDRGRFSPIPIFVDSRRLAASYQVYTTTLPPSPTYDSDKSEGRRALLAQIPVSGLDRPPLGYPIDDQPATGQPREKFGSLRLSAEPDRSVEAVVCVYSCLQRQSRLNLIMDGICLESPLLFGDPELAHFRPTFEDNVDDIVLDVFLAVSWDDLDLSQFSVRPQSYAAPVLACMPHICEALESTAKDCDKPWALCTEPPVKNAYSPVSLVELAGMGFLALFIPHAIVLGGVAGAAYAAYKAVEATGCLEQFNQRVHRNRADEMRNRLLEVAHGTRRLLPK